MEAFCVHVKPLEIEYGICKQDPYFVFLENLLGLPVQSILAATAASVLDPIRIVVARLRRATIAPPRLVRGPRRRRPWRAPLEALFFAIWLH